MITVTTMASYFNLQLAGKGLDSTIITSFHSLNLTCFNYNTEEKVGKKKEQAWFACPHNHY
jgi:hypothetical protein